MSKKRLVFATGNQGKVNEFRQMLGDDYEILSMKDIGELDFVNGYFLMVPELESYDAILSSLGM